MKKAFIQNSLKKIGKKHYTVLGAIILMIAVVHFVLQMSFIQSESQQVVETFSKNVKLDEQPDKIDAEKVDADAGFETEKVNESTAPKIVQPVVRKQTENTSRVLPKKKVVRETRAERLRRAEKMLTGV